MMAYTAHCDLEYFSKAPDLLNEAVFAISLLLKKPYPGTNIKGNFHKRPRIAPHRTTCHTMRHCRL